MEGLRSEPMKRVQLFVQTDTARAAVDQLARVGCLEFIDVCRYFLPNTLGISHIFLSLS
jgi:hypothetical protein